MSLTVVRPADSARQPRVGVWVKISISLIVVGLLAIVFAVVIGLRWYYGLNILQTTGTTNAASVSMVAGADHVIDELVVTRPSYHYLVNVRHVSVRLGTNTAGATVEVLTCPAGEKPNSAPVGGSSCASPTGFKPGPFELGNARILVRVHATKPGTVVVAGVNVSYRSGIRDATQRLGPTVTIAVRP